MMTNYRKRNLGFVDGKSEERVGGGERKMTEKEERERERKF